MKFRVSFKTPDALDYAIDNHFPNDVFAFDRSEEREQEQTMRECAKKFVQYGECITIEFDTEAGTATVVPVKG